MATPSNISVPALDELTADDIAKLDAPILLSLQNEFEEIAALLKARHEKFKSALEQRYGARSAEQRLSEGKDTGIVHIFDGELRVACNLRKKVEWDQAELLAIRKRIIEGGEDPAIYMKEEYRVAEAVYQGWPEQYKKAFLPARTVKPEKPAFSISDPNAPTTRGKR